MNTEQIIKLVTKRIADLGCDNAEIRTITFLRYLHETEGLNYTYTTYLDTSPGSLSIKLHLYEKLVIRNENNVKFVMDTRAISHSLEDQILHFIIQNLESFVDCNRRVTGRC